MKHAHSVVEVAGLLGMTPEATRQLIETVFGGPRDVVSFQDLVLLRTARKVPKTRITEALGRVRSQLDQPLSAVTLQQVGKELVVNVGAARWNAASGQQLLDLDRSRGRGATWLRPVPTRDADALFASAVRLEESDPTGALEAYAEAVAADPHHADAHVNLGRLLHQHGRLREAEAHYVAALVSRPTDATACFNLAGLYEKKGEKMAALRNLKDYRRLSSPR